MSQDTQKNKSGRPIIKDDLDKKALAELNALLKEDPLPPQAVVDVRHALGLSQTDFGEKLGVARRTVQDWEHGLRACKGAARMFVIESAKSIETVKAKAAA